jgi:hypothetical protein
MQSGRGLSRWLNGDFDLNGEVNFDDYVRAMRTLARFWPPCPNRRPR